MRITLGSELAEVDDRLLAFAPFFRRMFLGQQPKLARQVTEEVANEALTKALIAAGFARRFRGSDGVVRIEPTDRYFPYAPQDP